MHKFFRVTSEGLNLLKYRLALFKIYIFSLQEVLVNLTQLIFPTRDLFVHPLRPYILLALITRFQSMS